MGPCGLGSQHANSHSLFFFAPSWCFYSSDHDLSVFIAWLSPPVLCYKFPDFFADACLLLSLSPRLFFLAPPVITRALARSGRSPNSVPVHVAGEKGTGTRICENQCSYIFASFAHLCVALVFRLGVSMPKRDQQRLLSCAQDYLLVNQSFGA